MYNALLMALVAGFSCSALAMQPLQIMDPRDPDFPFYLAYVRLEDKTIAPNQLRLYADISEFGVTGRVVPIQEVQGTNFLNLVLAVNGGVYYVNSMLSDISSFKLRRRWEGYPGPGIYIRVEGTRYSLRMQTHFPIQLWIRIATPDGQALPHLSTFEGNYDL